MEKYEIRSKPARIRRTPAARRIFRIGTVIFFIMPSENKKMINQTRIL